MEYYLVLTVSTAIIAVIAVVLWVKTRSVSLPLGIAFMYYWSLYGGWSIVLDRLGGDSGKRYAYLEDKLFPVYLDDYYYWSLILYATFIVVVGTVLIFSVKAVGVSNRTARPVIDVSHFMIISLAATAGVASYLLVRSDMQSAAVLNKSLYSLTRSTEAEVGKYLTIHQELNRIALVPAALGFAILLSGPNPLLIAGRGSLWTGFGYLIVLGGMVWFAFLLGNKNELFLAGVAACLFYQANVNSPKVMATAVVAIAGLSALSLIDLLRGVPLGDLFTAIASLEIPDLEGISQFVASSNEAFGAHFSMYGALAYGISPTYGSSLLSLMASAIPRLLWPSRPEDIYGYYAESVGATPGQGYAIHHATGWYLNFGITGVIIGAILLGWIWARCFNGCVRARAGRSRWYYVLTAVAPWMFAAYIPSLIRAGPEGYKGLIIEGFLMPTLVLTVASYRWGVFLRSPAEPRQSISGSVGRMNPV